MATIIGFLRRAAARSACSASRSRGLAPEAIARKGIGLVPQGRRVFRTLTVRENLMVAAQSQKKDNGAGWTLERVFAAVSRG